MRCVVFSLVVLSGCASGGGMISENAPAATEVRDLLVLPMNFDSTPPSGLARGAKILEKEVVRYLDEDLGREVESLRLSEVFRHWRAVMNARDVGRDDPTQLSADDIDAARSALARRLAQAHPADAIVMPALLVREGRYAGVRLRWDGVSRPVPVREERGAIMTVHRISGSGMGTSLRISLFTPAGEKFFERYAGIEPTTRFEMTGFDGWGGGIQDYPRTDLFEEPELIEEAVELGFVPFFEPPEQGD